MCACAHTFFELALYPYGVYNYMVKERCERMQETKECGCHKTKERTEKEYKDLINRLNRIEGSVLYGYSYTSICSKCSIE